MRTSLNNLKLIDDFLLGNMPTRNALLFEANALINDDLANNVAVQKRTHSIIKQYGRQCIKTEIAAVQHKLNTEPQYKGFIQRISNYFKKH